MLPVRLALAIDCRTVQQPPVSPTAFAPNAMGWCATRTPRIREFRYPDDIQRWLEIQNDAFSAQRPRPWTARHFERELGRRVWWSPSCSWFAELRTDDSAARVVGSITLEIRDNREAELHWLAICQSAQSCGVGRELLRHAIRQCERHHVQRLWAETLRESSAERFYRGHGFRTP